MRQMNLMTEKPKISIIQDEQKVFKIDFVQTFGMAA
jgi:hypothetical protein